MMFMKYFYLFFFLTLVKSDDPLHYAKEQLFNCFKNCGLRSNEIINSQDNFTSNFEILLINWSITILQSKSEDIILTVGNDMYKYVCEKGQYVNEAKMCCYKYAREVNTLKRTMELVNTPYEHLITDSSREKKVLPTLLHEQDMIVDLGYDPVDDDQIVVLSENTEAADYIMMERLY
ncbi:uncharacterized protein LOC126899684 isoform X2 [Daktulosphaira vitifoliae]|uniref:uncharacterized protein LOC126899684 isoform X2 n=1 Tax=Daktulosphaira vitifoliae TaxID=58002 RepID=UPI0021AACFBF|nr:uncharacterized protein LOC126899684 isoform X2 [Daktulosphaira vitifoliae]